MINPIECLSLSATMVSLAVLAGILLIIIALVFIGFLVIIYRSKK
jgi:hypothetical protein